MGTFFSRTGAAAALAALLLSGCGKPSDPARPAGVGPAVTAPAAIQDGGLSRQQLENGALEPTCSLENVVALGNDQRFTASQAVYAVPKGMAVKLIGFGTSKAKGTDLGAFTLLLASASAVFKVDGQAGLERPDVAAFFNAPGMGKAGFQIDVDLKDLPAGDYAVYLRTPAGVGCPTHHTIRIQ
jgi:hypothetical protein